MSIGSVVVTGGLFEDWELSDSEFCKKRDDDMLELQSEEFMSFIYTVVENSLSDSLIDNVVKNTQSYIWGSIKNATSIVVPTIMLIVFAMPSIDAEEKDVVISIKKRNGRGGIRTHEATATDLKSVPFNHSGTLPGLYTEMIIFLNKK